MVEQSIAVQLLSQQACNARGTAQLATHESSNLGGQVVMLAGGAYTHTQASKRLLSQAICTKRLVI